MKRGLYSARLHDELVRNLNNHRYASIFLEKLHTHTRSQIHTHTHPHTHTHTHTHTRPQSHTETNYMQYSMQSKISVIMIKHTILTNHLRASDGSDLRIDKRTDQRSNMESINTAGSYSQKKTAPI